MSPTAAAPGRRARLPPAAAACVAASASRPLREAGWRICTRRGADGLCCCDAFALVARFVDFSRRSQAAFRPFFPWIATPFFLHQGKSLATDSHWIESHKLFSSSRSWSERTRCCSSSRRVTLTHPNIRVKAKVIGGKRGSHEHLNWSNKRSADCTGRLTLAVSAF